MPQSKFYLTALTEDDLSKTAHILERYQDSWIDFVDATVMAIAGSKNNNCVDDSKALGTAFH